MRIGVLAIQGAFAEHMEKLNKLDVPCFEIRNMQDLSQTMDGLILPGGESTTMGKLLRDLGLFAPIKENITQGLPVFGTCAGMILLASQIERDTAVHFATMDMCVVRNAFGRQLGSFSTTSSFHDLGKVEMPFIRAPYIRSVGAGVNILSVVDNKIVAARQNNQLVTAFHPELTDNDSIHRYFIDMVLGELPK